MNEDRPAWLDALLEASRQGDRAEFDRQFVHCQKLILRSVEKQMSRRLRGRITPEDVAQEVQLKVAGDAAGKSFENLHAFRGWIDEIARNCLFDQERREFGLKRGTDPLSLEKTTPGGGSTDGWLRDAIPGPHPTPSKEVSKKEEIDGIPALLEKIPRDLREILRMAHFERLTHAQIASRTDMTPEAVRKAIARAYEACRKAAGPGKRPPGGISGT